MMISGLKLRRETIVTLENYISVFYPTLSQCSVFVEKKKEEKKRKGVLATTILMT